MSTEFSYASVKWTASAVFFLTAFLAFASMLPQGSTFSISPYAVTLCGKYLAYALLALSVDLVWGFAGILTLGHAAFFALGAYGMGMYLTREIGARGVYGNPDMPDFMVFLSWHRLPWYWWGSDHVLMGVALTLLMPAALAGVFGWLAFRARVSGVYLSIITQALTYALMLAFFQNGLGFGGNNGLTGFKDVVGFDLTSGLTRAVLLLLSGAVVAAVLLGARFLVSGRYGRVLIAVRDTEARTRFLGYRPERIKLVVWIISAIIAAIGGALYVLQVGIVNPGEFAPANSIEAVIWVAVGGRGTLTGAVIGAIAVNFGKTVFTAVLPELWLYGLGALFLATTVFLPQGVMGLLRHGQPRRIAEVTPDITDPEGSNA